MVITPKNPELRHIHTQKRRNKEKITEYQENKTTGRNIRENKQWRDRATRKQKIEWL